MGTKVKGRRKGEEMSKEDKGSSRSVPPRSIYAGSGKTPDEIRREAGYDLDPKFVYPSEA